MKIFRNRDIRGAISIFLIIITIPTMLLSAVLIDGSRVVSAKAMTQEATDLAAASVLADYNQMLKDEFGLFALNESNEEKLKSIYQESLNATLMAYGMSGNEEYSERIWDIMKTTLTGQKSYMGESFLNLYDFQVDRCTVKPLFSLAEQSVLENQMVEYSKFRGLYVMTDRMDIFQNLGNLKAEAEKNQTATKVMEDKMEVDETNAAADEALVKLRTEIDTLNERVTAVKKARENYLTSLRAKMKELYINNTDSDEEDEGDDREMTTQEKRAANAYGNNRTALKEAAKLACQQAKVVLNQAETAKKEIEKAIDNLEKFKSRNQGNASGNETVGKMIEDADKNITFYKDDYLSGVQSLIDDGVLKQMGQDSGIQLNLDNVMKSVHEGITKYIEDIEKMREEYEDDEEGEELEITEYYYYYLNSNTSKTTSINSAVATGGENRGYEPTLNKYLDYFIKSDWNRDTVNPAKKFENESSNKINEDFAKEQSGKTGGADTNQDGEAPRGTVEDAVYRVRPSVTGAGGAEKGKENNTDFYNKNNDLSASKNILKQGERSMILDVAEMMRDDVLCLTYMFGTFKTRLTGIKKFSSEGIPNEDKNNFYMPEWRYAHPDGELDMRLDPKKDRKTVLRSEIEYLVYGNQSDEANEAAVYATIFAERMANNMIAMCAKESINSACHAAAAAACAASFGTVPEPVFFWIFLTAWATAETIIEMDYLISGGYKIPLLKNTENILLTDPLKESGTKLIEHYGESGVFVSYEDYLLLLLLIKGREKRIMRSADLIEMNMKKAGKSDFTMAKAYTYLYADTSLSIRYLFGNVMPFGSAYEKNGYTGRLHYTNTIYQGY